MYNVEMKKVVEKMKLISLTPDIGYDDLIITQSEVNRPALQLTGFFNYFSSDRIQIIGKVEHTYIDTLEDSVRNDMFDKFFSYQFPCLIISRDLEPHKEMLENAVKYKVPVFRTNNTTSYFIAELITYLKAELAPRISMHGGLVDVFGEGILIIGESGIGKSEAALELIKRGHRLVADDVVEVKRISEDVLLGTSPSIIQHFIELRGIGIVDCKTLFGVESVKKQQNINLVIELEEWDPNKEYDRVGLEEQFTEILGNKVTCHKIPIRPGRNIAIIVESAAINHRQKEMGYNAALELNNRVTQNIEMRTKERENKERSK